MEYTDTSSKASFTTVAVPPGGIKTGEPIIQADLDLGKVHDPSVLTITEAQRWYMGLIPDGENPSYYDAQNQYHANVPRYKPSFETRFTVKYMDCMPLETPYATIAEHVAQVFCSGAAPRPVQRFLYVDSTGVGQGVVEMVRTAIKAHAESQDVMLRPITLTYGQKEYRLGEQTASKHSLVARLLELLSTDTIIAPPELREMLPVRDELLAFQERVSEDSGRASFGGRPGTHDDIVISLALSVLADPFKYQVHYSQRIY